MVSIVLVDAQEADGFLADTVGNGDQAVGVIQCILSAKRCAALVCMPGINQPDRSSMVAVSFVLRGALGVAGDAWKMTSVPRSLKIEPLCAENTC